MTRFRPPTGLFALTACLLWLLAWPACRALAQTTPEPARGESGAGAASVHFDLPAQPLARALQGFARVTELVVLASAPLLEGRMSAPLAGDYAPREALRRVLVGTGLRADFTRPDEAIIVADPASASAAPAAAGVTPDGALPVDGIEGSEARSAFAGALQARMIDVLCAQPGAVPGTYRFVAQLHIDEKGAVVSVNQVTSSGVAARDAAILRALRALRLDTMPPADLPQPVTILLRPVGRGVHLRCPSSATGN